ncbi:type I-C CRISPR-associated protein Cas8c/Csd1 [Paenibacillus athensensis]|uniref:Type I-C CRISPR-associated protein Cas8c/Csd1 n=1 Tax=Paenibacillus athensensis TaxID=1967502 RepID=A0A4Y8PZG2_9BACL|nr:type I-C CRISPR-associated protein Cas8c/Csd1 [Paenibacillus athensensis]MCD1261221.1 type I-C CRISPR-associated protein Cas8c/Csd1 [Paenibacillus athensensis]
MSWLLNLYETYKLNENQVGKIEIKHNEQEFTLLPVSHTTQQAHIEVRVTEEGEFHSANVIDKSDMNTLIPCTEDSANRAGSKIAPYPLHDKLSYVAGDFVAYGGEIKKEEPFVYYIKQLESWAASPYSTPQVKSIYHYLNKRRLIQDLVAEGILFVDGNGQLVDKWDKSAEASGAVKPSIFTAISSDQSSAFVRFTVYSPDSRLTKVWQDPEMYDSFIHFYSSQLGAEDFCYVTGQWFPSTDKHANKIRHAGDKAKLISANDTSGFTFRGRFQNSQDAASISYEVSQKAHNALKWLINRQAKTFDQRVFLVWGNQDLDVPEFSEDLFAIFPSQSVINERVAFTNKEFAREIAKAFDGFRGNLSSQANVNILIVDSATTGRMAVLYYRNMQKELYLDRLVDWHSTCIWLHRYRKDKDGQFVQFLGAPATKDIAFAAYGTKAGDKVVKGLMERILPCIIDEGRDIPRDIIVSARQRASNPVSMERWEWEKTLSIACALINRKEKCSVALDTTNYDRSYLFGRLLAVADMLEKWALGKEDRETNAARYMHAFSMHPARTWRTIQDSLLPYKAKLGRKAKSYNDLIDEILSHIPADQFNNERLADVYLLGFSSQRHELRYVHKQSSDAEEAAE